MNKIKKICTACHKRKPLEKFWGDKKGKFGRHSQCKACRRIYNHEYYGVNRKKVLEKRRDYRRVEEEAIHRRKIERVYGLPSEQYEKMLETQNHRCAICQQQEHCLIRGKPARLAVDHDRKTGRIRGLLCRRCNLFIGQADHNVETLRAAINYLGQKDH